MSDRGRGRGAAGEAGAGLKIVGVNDLQRVESLAERTDRIAGKKQERPYKATLRAARNIDQLVVEARVRNRGVSGLPSRAGRAAC